MSEWLRRKATMTEAEKLQFALDLGVSTNALYSTNGVLNEAELDSRVLAAEAALVGHPAAEPERAGLHPWPILVSQLFELSSDEVIEIIDRSGLRVDWSLSHREGYSHTTRKRAFRPRVDREFNKLSDQDQLRVAHTVAREIETRSPNGRDALNELLRPIGWGVSDLDLVPTRQDVAELFFPQGTPHDAYVQIRGIFNSATQSITVVDPYLDTTVLGLISTTDARPLRVRLLSKSLPTDFQLELNRFRDQHPEINIQVRTTVQFHDRFLVVDDSVYVHLGASIKDAGKRAFMLSRVEDAGNRGALAQALNDAWESATPAVARD